MKDPSALFIRYTGEDDPILNKIVSELEQSPSKSLREIVTGWLDELDQLKQEREQQQTLHAKLDLLLDIHNSYIIQNEIYAVYPLAAGPADMIRGLEDKRLLAARMSKDVTE